MKHRSTFSLSPMRLSFLLALVFLFIVGCSSPASTEESGGDMPDMAEQTNPDEDMADMEEDDSEHNMDSMDETEHDGAADHDTAEQQFVPNNGAVVHITSPADGDTFKSDETIPVIIETTGFVIGENGNHWHIFLDGRAIMVSGGETFVLQSLSPGEHEIKVHLSLGTHENLEEGDMIHITVEE